MRLAPVVAAPLFGSVLAAGLFVSARDLDQVAQAGQLGPGFWPRLALLGLGLACLAKTAGEWRSARTGGAPARAAEALPEISAPGLGVGIALILLYVMAAPTLGFPLATALFIAAFMRLAGARSVIGIGTSAGLGTVCLLYVFVKLVYLPLPKGAGPLEGLTLAVYRALRLF